MTREEAIRWMNSLKKLYKSMAEEAFDMAIRALSYDVEEKVRQLTKKSFNEFTYEGSNKQNEIVYLKQDRILKLEDAIAVVRGE